MKPFLVVPRLFVIARLMQMFNNSLTHSLTLCLQITKHCKESLVNSDVEMNKDNILDIREAGKGQVEECLKERFRKKLIKDRDCRTVIYICICNI